jgi:hypothetical protein
METERGIHPGMGVLPQEAMRSTTQGAALGETVKVGLDQAGALG